MLSAGVVLLANQSSRVYRTAHRAQTLNRWYVVHRLWCTLPILLHPGRAISSCRFAVSLFVYRRCRGRERVEESRAVRGVCSRSGDFGRDGREREDNTKCARVLPLQSIVVCCLCGLDGYLPVKF